MMDLRLVRIQNPETQEIAFRIDAPRGSSMTTSGHLAIVIHPDHGTVFCNLETGDIEEPTFNPTP